MRALLLTGTLGSGKTAVAVEVGHVLEASSSVAVVDLDWLCWVSGDAVLPALTRNLAAVVDTYRDLGVEQLVLARALRSADDLAAVVAGLGGADLFVVRLAVGAATLRARLASRDSGLEASQHADELEAFTASVEAAGLEDVIVSNDDRAIGDVAGEVITAWRAATR